MSFDARMMLDYEGGDGSLWIVKNNADIAMKGYWEQAGRRKREKLRNAPYPRYFKWVNGIQKVHEDGTKEWLTQWPDPENPDAELF